MATNKNDYDIRPRIAQGKHYDPMGDQEKVRNYNPDENRYPRFVTRADGRQFVANTPVEEKEILNIVTPPPRKVDVDVQNLVMPETQAAPKRGRPPKAVVAPLPSNLE